MNTGPTGTIEEVSPTGPTGTVEEVGPTGPTGPTGTVEEVGPTGPTGTVEEVGPTGPTGAVEEVGPTGPTGTVEEVGPTGTTGTIEEVGTIAIQPTPPPPILLDDILSSVEVLRVSEAEHKSLLESIGTLSAESIRPRLIQWATSGFRNAYPIHELYLSPPSLCSDGQTRSLQDYIEFVSGKTIQDHVAVLQARMPDIIVSFAYTGVSIVIVVSKGSQM